MLMSKLKRGDNFRVVAINLADAFKVRLAEMGLGVGTEHTIMQRSAFGAKILESGVNGNERIAVDAFCAGKVEVERL
ncbi:MAG: ferrous iron transport protein A [Candidatus Ancillula sp.]|jgi:Fe2+ transport system protein FeoA|nr:ferrous iron transport protein A [Candidatus Ancillula sp.]